MIGVLFGQVRPTLPSVAVALGGAGLAYLWLEVSFIAAAAIAVSLLVVGAIAYSRGDSCLNRETPTAVASRRWLEVTLAAPIAVAALAAAGIIVLGIETAPAKDWSEQQKQLTAAAAAAITTYLTTVFVKGADEADEGWVGTIVKERFQQRLKDRFPAGKARDAVHDIIRGWDRETRKTRAEEIDGYIAAGGALKPRS